MTASKAQAHVAANIDEVRGRIAGACERAGRSASSVTLIGVTKTVGSEPVRAAINAGLRDLGENYVREGIEKMAAIGAGLVRWHLIGHLQSNKARVAAEAFDILHAVDSIRLAEAISRRAARSVPVLLEVNVAREPGKFGFDSADVAAAVAATSALPGLQVLGLMTVAPAVADPELVRPVFRELRQLAEANGLKELSMGMSGDYEVAIEEGATMVRVGRAIFGGRA